MSFYTDLCRSSTFRKRKQLSTGNARCKDGNKPASPMTGENLPYGN